MARAFHVVGLVLGLVFSRAAKAQKRVGLSCVRTAELGKSERRTADPFTTLRSGRDDNFVWEREVLFSR